MAGVPLEPGERVLYFRRIDQMSGRVLRIVVGLVMIPFLIGFVFLYRVFSEWRLEPDAQAITNRRLLSFKTGGKLLVALRWEEVVGFTKVLRRRAMPNMAVRTQAGPQLLFAEDGHWLESTLPVWLQQPQIREQSPEVPFAVR